MLAASADFLFLVDESGSEQNTHTQDWLATVIDDLHVALAAADIDARFGLLGFGQDDDNGTPTNFNDDIPRNAHSQLVGPTGNKDLWTTDYTELVSAIGNDLGDIGQASSEDGWDGIEHAIAEYDFREGAVPIVVLVQADQGRTVRNDTLTHDGVLAALKSKTVVLNTVIAGPLLVNGELPTIEPNEPLSQPSGAEFDWAPIFDLAAYGLDEDIYVLGVEADSADGVRDRNHAYHAFDTVNDEVPESLTTTESDALQISYNGSNTGDTGMVGSGKSILIGQTMTGGIGPTTEGYSAKSVPFSVVDMTGATEHTNLAISISYSFPFYGTTETSLWVNEDGTISFDSAFTSGDNVDLSQAVTGQTRPSDPMIAALWDDMAPASSGTLNGRILTSIADFDGDQSDDLAIQWTEYRYAGDQVFSDHDPITFQAVLYGNGSIQFNYIDIVSYSDNNGELTIENTGGVGSTVGIWSGSADEITLAAGTFVPGPHSIQTDESGETSDSYIRMAWDTGGAAWDVGLVDRFGSTSLEANALRDAFIASLGEQILRADKLGKVYREEEVVLAINYGGNALTDEGFDEDTGDTADTRLTTNESIDTTSNSIPLVDDPPAKAHDVFQSARTGDTTNFQDDDINLTFSTLESGTYVVELFFAELDQFAFPGGRVFDVVVEGQTLLNDYDLYDDRGRIVTFSSVENDVVQLGGVGDANDAAGIVKRFAVQVSDADGSAGLQIDLMAEVGDPILNGLRVLKSNALAPRVTNVVLKSTEWADGIEHSYAEAVFLGEQLRPMFREKTDLIEVHFDGPVKVEEGDFTLYDSATTTVTPDDFFYNPHSHVAIWTFDEPLEDSKYRLELSTDITGGGNALNGEWENQTIDPHVPPGTPDNLSDDPTGREFITGTGTAGSTGNVFQFLFALLPGDTSGDGIVNSGDYVVFGDVDGDGDSDGDDTTLKNMDYWGSYLPLRKNNGDYNDDEVVDIADRAFWASHFGSTTDLSADGNGDGIVNGADFTLWSLHNGSESAWADVLRNGGGSFAPQALVGVAPAVMNVTISGSNSQHDPYSFENVVGSGEQLRTVPVGGADTISITFSEDVNVSANLLRMTGMYTANLPELVEFDYDMTTWTASWRFTGMTFGDMYLITLNDAVTDIDGDALDGEWTNPAHLTTTNTAVSEFPSGDGNPGGAFNFLLTLLPGDANLDGSVDGLDLAILSDNWGISVDMLFSDGDFNGDGAVSITDLVYMSESFNLSFQQAKLLADLDGDWDVDEDDLDAVFDNWWNGLQNPTESDGDLDGDGDVDADDFDLAFAQMGLELSVVS